MKKITLLTLLFLAGCGDTVNVPEQTDSVPNSITIEFVTGGDTTLNCDKIIYSTTRLSYLRVFQGDIEVYRIEINQVKGFVYE